MDSFIDIVGHNWPRNAGLRTPLQPTVVQRGLPPRWPQLSQIAWFSEKSYIYQTIKMRFPATLSYDVSRLFSRFISSVTRSSKNHEKLLVIRGYVCVFIKLHITAQSGPVIYSFYATACNPPGCVYVCMVFIYSRLWINRVRLPVYPARGQLNKENVWCASRVRPSRPASACSFSTLRLNLVLTHGIFPDFRVGVHSFI